MQHTDLHNETFKYRYYCAVRTMKDVTQKIKNIGTALVGAAMLGNTQAQTLGIDDDAMLGKPNAPVTMIEVGDYQSPYVRRFWTETLPLIKENYIAKGEVRMVFRDFPIEQIHASDMIAAQAAECVRAQGGDAAFWRMQDKIFAEQNIRDSGSTNGPVTKNIDFSANDLKQWAQSLGYDISDCLATEQFRAEVENDFNNAFDAGIQGIPAFVINGTTILGAQPYAVFRDALDNAAGRTLGIEGKVLLWSEAAKSDGTVTNEFAPGETLTFTVYADNRGLHGQKTGYIAWNILTSLDATAIQPINNQHYGANDFFYPLFMSGNSLETKNAWRAPKLRADPEGRDGVADKVGIVAKYAVTIPQNALPGAYSIRTVQVNVESDTTSNGSVKEPAHTRTFSIAVKDPAETRPVVALTSNRDNDHVVHVAARPEYAVELSRSTDLKEWYSVARGKGSFDFADTNTTGMPNLFYRAVGALESPSGGGGGGGGRPTQ